MLYRQQIQENRFVLAFDKNASALKEEAHKLAEFLKTMSNQSEYAKQLVIELEELYEVKGIGIKKNLSHIAYLIQKLSPYSPNKVVWFKSITQEQYKTLQKHMINLNIAIVDTLGKISGIEEE